MSRIPIAAAVIILFDVAPVAAQSLIRAAVVDGHAYVSPLANGRGGDMGWHEAGGNFILYGRDFTQPGKRITLTHPVVIESQFNAQVLHRWQVDRKRVHFLQFNSWNDGDANACERPMWIASSPLDLVRSLKTPIPAGADGAARREEFSRTRTGESSPGWMRSMAGRLGQRNSVFISFDFLPAADGRYEWYVNDPNGDKLRLTRLDSLPTVKPAQAEWVETAAWPSAIGDRFFAVPNGDDRFFVTEGGKVYLAPPAAKGAKPAKTVKEGPPLKEVWDGKSAVDALIHDVDKEKWYGFTKDQYFEIADPIKPLPHALGLERAKTAKDAVDAAAKCARVVRGLPEPKDK